jgi:hypothetical protein
VWVLKHLCRFIQQLQFLKFVSKLKHFSIGYFWFIMAFLWSSWKYLWIGWKRISNPDASMKSFWYILVPDHYITALLLHSLSNQKSAFQGVWSKTHPIRRWGLLHTPFGGAGGGRQCVYQCTYALDDKFWYQWSHWIDQTLDDSLNHIQIVHSFFVLTLTSKNPTLLINGFLYLSVHGAWSFFFFFLFERSQP